MPQRPETEGTPVAASASDARHHGPRALLALSLLAVCAAGGCAPRTPAETLPVVQARSDSAFSLRVGQEAELDGASRLRFVGVGDDSRCPQDVTCVWAGDARVTLVLTQAGAEGREVELHTTVEPRSASAGGYRFTLESLLPAPRGGRPIEPTGYVAGLRASRE